MTKAGRAALAILAAGAILLVVAWFDTSVMLDMKRQMSATFDSTGLLTATSLGSLLVAGSVLLLAVLAWRSQSVLVGVVYTIAGAFFVFLPMIFIRLASQFNDVSPVLPQPIAQAVTEIYFRSAGQLDAVGTIGAGMLIIGLAVLVWSYRGRAVASTSHP